MSNVIVDDNGDIQLTTVVNEMQTELIREEISMKPVLGYGQCPDCIWYKVKEGCNVERGYTVCCLNYERKT